MLYDPTWNRPETRKFIQWLSNKPKDEKYDWKDPCNCACAQYWGNEAIGHWIPKNRMIEDTEGLNFNRLAYGPSQMTEPAEWTFGALLERVQEAIVTHAVPVS